MRVYTVYTLYVHVYIYYFTPIKTSMFHVYSGEYGLEHYTEVKTVSVIITCVLAQSLTHLNHCLYMYREIITYNSFQIKITFKIDKFAIEGNVFFLLC